VGQDAAQDAQNASPSELEAEPLTLEDAWVQEPEDGAEEDEFFQQTPDRSWILPAAAILAVVVWTSLFVWSNIDAIVAGAPLQQWVSLACDPSVRGVHGKRRGFESVWRKLQGV
jgi:hypothetical protein